MPTYVYELLTSGARFEVRQRLDEPALTVHPETGEAVRRVVQAPAIHLRGLPRSTRVDKSSPAATACGCASNAALARQMYANSRNTPVYGSLDSVKTVVGGFAPKSKPGSCGHAHKHSGSCGHKH